MWGVVRLKAGGKPRRDPDRAREAGRRHYRRKMAARAAGNACRRCGKRPPAPGRINCHECGEQLRAAARARYHAGREAGLAYGLSRILDKPYYPECRLIRSDVPATAFPWGFPAHRLQIIQDGQFPRSTSMSSSLTPVNFPGRTSGGLLASSISSFSAGVARRYISVVLRSA